MAEIIKYIKKSYKPKDSREFLELFPFDFKLDKILEMVNDGIFVIYSCTKDIQVTLESVSNQLEFILVADIVIGRRTIKQIQWLTNGTVQFPEKGNFLFQRLHPNDFNPIMYETVDHTLIISELVKSTHREEHNMYIEFGTRDNKNFSIISDLVFKAIGVDMNPEKSHPNIYVNTTDHFCEFTLPQVIRDTFIHSINDNLRIKLNYAFIDADHSAKSAFNDFKNLFKYIEVGGYIILHDTYPIEQHFLNENACHDCYKTPLLIKSNYSKYINILTLPLNPGITIVQKKCN